MAKIMRTFKLNEISGVYRPAQKGALAVIMKRDASADAGPYLAKADDLPDVVKTYLKRVGDTAMISKGEAMDGGAFPIQNRTDLEHAIRAIACAKDQNTAKNHIVARARSLDATSVLPSGWSTAKSIGGDLIMEITRVAPRALPDLLSNVTKAEEIEAQVAKITDAKVRKKITADLQVAKSALVASAWSVVDSLSGEDAASLLQKNFAEYKTHVEGLAPNGADKGDEIMLKAIAKSLGLAETATEAEITKALADQAAALVKATSLAEMSGVHKSYLDSEGDKIEGGRDAFIAMKAEARDAHMKAWPPKKKTPAPADDENDCMKVDGKTIRKADVGEATFSVLKSQQERLEKGDTERAISAISKRIAPTLTLVIGKADDTAAVLHRIETGKTTKADAEAVETMLAAANAQLTKAGVLTKEIGAGSGTGGFAKAIDAINSAAQELMKKDAKLTLAKARSLVRDTNPELRKQEEIEAKEARAAA